MHDCFWHKVDWNAAQVVRNCLPVVANCTASPLLGLAACAYLQTGLKFRHSYCAIKAFMIADLRDCLSTSSCSALRLRLWRPVHYL